MVFILRRVIGRRSSDSAEALSCLIERRIFDNYLGIVRKTKICCQGSRSILDFSKDYDHYTRQPYDYRIATAAPVLEFSVDSESFKKVLLMYTLPTG